MRLTEEQDAYGRAMLDWNRGNGGFEIVERDDGYIGLSSGPQAYLAEYRHWPEFEKRAIRLARGRVLDVGSGGGRVGLYLQGRGHEVVGIDNSPGAVELCHERGFGGAVLVPFEEISRRRLGTFDTVVMIGNNFGLVGGRRRARARLRRLFGMTTDRGRILAASMDPYATDAAHHVDYHARNRLRGRMGGQVRIRIRYQMRKTPYFDYLFVTKEELDELLDGTGWRVTRHIDSETAGQYVAVIERA